MNSEAAHPTQTARPVYRRLLIRGVNWLGDAIMTTPALQRLREALPGCHITLLSHEKLADLWTHHPSIDEVMIFKEEESLMSVAGRIKQGQFDAALILPNSPRSALETWLAGVPERIGYGRPWRNFCLTRKVEDRAEGMEMRKRTPDEIRKLIDAGPGVAPARIPASAHHIYGYLHLAAALGASAEPVAPMISVESSELQSAAERFGLGMPDESEARPWFGLNAGAEYGPAKRWPIERFAASALEIKKRTNCRWVLLGGPNDKIFAERIARAIEAEGGHSNCVNLAGRTTLRELCAVLKLCRVLLTNDTGPMHVAAAVGTPVVVPFGSTSPEMTGPGLMGGTHQMLRAGVPCAPCFLRVCPIDMRCMTGISEREVVEAVVKASARS